MTAKYKCELLLESQAMSALIVKLKRLVYSLLSLIGLFLKVSSVL